MPKNTIVNYRVPDHIQEFFNTRYDEILKEQDGDTYGIRSRIITEALEAYFHVEPSVKVKIQSIKEVKFKAEPEALVHGMEHGRSYSYNDLMELSGLSRTTVRRLITDNPQFFKEVDPDSRVKAFELATERPRRGRKKRRKKRKKEYKPNTQMELTRYARNGLQLFDVIEDNRDSGVLVKETITYVDLGEGRKRQLGRIEDELVIIFPLTDMENDGIITEDEKETYFLKYYHENPKTWKQEYEGRLDLLKSRLDQYDVVRPKVEKLFEEYQS